MDPVLSPRSEATSWQTSGDTQADFARAIGSRIREPISASTPPALVPGVGVGVGGPPLPPGWEAIQDGAQGTRYYYHAPSGVSQWEPPTEVSPPATVAAPPAPTTPTAPATRELTSLSIDEVGLLLGSLGMEALRPNFAAGFVDGASLAQIDGHDLGQLGVSVGAVRRGMLARVDRLRALGVPGHLLVREPTEMPPAAAALAALPLEPTLAALRRWGVEPAVAATCCERSKSSTTFALEKTSGDWPRRRRFVCFALLSLASFLRRGNRLTMGAAGCIFALLQEKPRLEICLIQATVVCLTPVAPQCVALQVPKHTD